MKPKNVCLEAEYWKVLVELNYKLPDIIEAFDNSDCSVLLNKHIRTLTELNQLVFDTLMKREE